MSKYEFTNHLGGFVQCFAPLPISKACTRTQNYSYITLLSSWLITGNSAKLMPLVMPTCTMRGIAPAKKADGPSFFIICMAQSTVPLYNSFAASLCIRDFTQSCGCVSRTDPQPARKPAAPL